MARKLLIQTELYPYHITNRSNNKDFFYLPQNELWLLFKDVLSELKKKYHCEVLSFVLMYNHYHLLMSTPHSNLSDAMLFFHREVARRANKKSQRINHFFGGRYKWCLIENERYFWNATKYILRNPVEANLSERVETYPYSSLNENNDIWHMYDFFGNKSNKIILDLDWLNQSFRNEDKESIKKALRRRRFEYPIGKNKKRIELPIKA